MDGLAFMQRQIAGRCQIELSPPASKLRASSVMCSSRLSAMPKPSDHRSEPLTMQKHLSCQGNIVAMPQLQERRVLATGRIDELAIIVDQPSRFVTLTKFVKIEATVHGPRRPRPPRHHQRELEPAIDVEQLLPVLE